MRRCEKPERVIRVVKGEMEYVKNACVLCSRLTAYLLNSLR
jgi:hypothetical protein